MTKRTIAKKKNVTRKIKMKNKRSQVGSAKKKNQFKKVNCSPKDKNEINGFSCYKCFPQS